MTTRTIRLLVRVSSLLLLLGVFGACTRVGKVDATAAAPFRVATFNIEQLSTEKIATVDANGRGSNEQLLAATEIIQRIHPDILVLNELDHDWDAVRKGGAPLEKNLLEFEKNYLAQGEHPVTFKYAYAAPCNTGFLSGFDLDNDGKVATDADVRTRNHGNDCFGYGEYPGQFSIGILSNFPIDREHARTFQKFLWKDLPGNHIPPGWYSDEELGVFRLSSKSHWDVPIQIGDRTLHMLLSHPTPPSFDGPEDRNGRRNLDEILFWSLYLDGSDALYDDQGRRGGFTGGGSFVFAGDLNASPNGGDKVEGQEKPAVRNILDKPQVQDPVKLGMLSSKGALRGKKAGPPDYFDRATSGWRLEGMRVDYVLPGTDLMIRGGDVFWPSKEDDPAGAELAEKASDHRCVWLDLKFKPKEDQPRK